MPSTSSNTDGAPLSLKFVVVGGGIAGLATAFTLKRAGHSVVVLEKRNSKTMSFGQAGGGIRAPPNMTKLLYRWGLGPILSEKALKCDRLIYVNANSGGLLGAIVLNEEFLKDLIADMILIKHGDLLNILHDLAFREGVEIRQNANVVYADPESATVRLETGETVTGDIIVVADGCSSSLRSAVTGYPQESHFQTGTKVLFVAFTVDTNLLKEDESFKTALEPTHWLTWIAEDTIAHTYAMDGEELLVGALSREYQGELREGDEEWSDARDLQSYGLDFTALEPRLRKIFELSKTVASRIFLKRPMPDELVNDQSSVVLVGEAAHPLVCEGSHGTALVIEDAETLGSLFSRVQSRAQVSQLLTAYEEIRHPRCEQTHLHHQRLDAIMKYPVGPQQQSRDTILRQTLAYGVDHMEAAGFQTMFGDHLISFAYDAGEAVDDWWAKWGSFLLTDKDKRRQSGSPGLQVWISQERKI